MNKLDLPVTVAPGRIVLRFPFPVSGQGEDSYGRAGTIINVSEVGVQLGEGFAFPTITLDLDAWKLSEEADSRIYEAAREAMLTAFVREIITVTYRR